jgi:ABC-type multidrug transport system ATPase subunit
MLAILGHNGAGKSTMINVLTGLLSASSGTAEIVGYDIRE